MAQAQARAPEVSPGVLVYWGDLAADLLRGPRRGDHLVADLDAMLAGDPELELREEGEGGNAAGPRGPAHQGMVPNGIQLEGDDLRTASEDLGSDRSADVEHVPDAEEGDHRTWLQGLGRLIPFREQEDRESF